MAGFDVYDSNQRTAVLRYLANRTLPIVQIESDGHVRVNMGTATLFEIAGHGVLVTAAHVIREMHARRGHRDDGLACHFVPQRARSDLRPIPLGGVTLSLKERSDRLNQDIGFFALDDETFAELKEHYTSVTPRDLLGGTDQDNGVYVVCGYPSETTDPHNPEPYTLLVASYNNEVEPHHPTDPASHLFLSHGPERVELTADEVDRTPKRADDGPRLHGISGSTVWRVAFTEDSALAWSPDFLHVAAVQTGYLPGKWIRGTRWSLVAQVIRDHHPDEEVRLAIGRLFRT